MLWFNSDIKINTEYIFYEDWYAKGVNSIKDLLSNKNGLLSYDDFIDKYQVKSTRLKYMGVIDAIPSDWRKHLKTETLLLNLRTQWTKLKSKVHMVRQSS